MDEAEIIVDLSSNSPKRVLSAVVALNDIMASDSIEPELVQLAFESILPLLSHTHYKIRAYAFSILTKFFENYLGVLSNALMALPQVLLSLLSVSPQIKENAYTCLAIIFENFKASEFWFDIEGIITKGRSLDERVRVLALLRDIASRIPLSPIVKLVDDPLFQIRAEAFAILSQAPQEKVKKAVKETKITYDGLKLLMSKLPFLNNASEFLTSRRKPPSNRSSTVKKRARPQKVSTLDTIDMSEVTESMASMHEELKVAGSSSSSASISRHEEEEEVVDVFTKTTVPNSESHVVFSTEEPVSSARSHGPEPTGAARNHERDPTGAMKGHERDPVSAARNHEREPIGATRSHEHETTGAARSHGPEQIGAARTHERELAGAARSHGPEQTDAARSHEHEPAGATRSQGPDTVGAARRETLRRGSPRSMGPLRDLSRRGIERRRAAGEKNLDSPLAAANLSGLQKISDVDLRRIRSLASPARNQTGSARKKEFRPGRLKLGPKQEIVKAKTLLALEEEEEQEAENFNTLGSLEISTSGNVFRVRDMSRSTWLEKLSFLDYMKESLERNAQIASTPEELVDCLMAMGNPPHKKITFAIPPILAEVLIRHPEVLGTKLRDILRYTLFAMVGDFWRDEPDFEGYLSILIQEADPTEIVANSLILVDRTERPLPFELLIMFVYEQRNDLRLPYSVAAHLICTLLNKPNRSPSQEELLRFVCEREVSHAVQWGTEQPAPVRRRLVPYVKGHTAALKKDASAQPQKRGPEIRTTDPRKLLALATEEIKKGRKANLSTLCAALGMFEGELPYKIYTGFLDVVGKVPEAVIGQNASSLRKLCATTFDQPSFMGFFHEDWVPPERVTGFSRVVWSCNMDMLRGSDKHYPRLYEIFLDSTGPVRLDLCKIFLAIERVTSHSILELDAITGPYRRLIESNMKQFRIVK